jgi:hypothetical protein
LEITSWVFLAFGAFRAWLKFGVNSLLSRVLGGRKSRLGIFLEDLFYYCSKCHEPSKAEKQRRNRVWLGVVRRH